jgi:phosphoribosylanthranilate isomerase
LDRLQLTATSRADICSTLGRRAFKAFRRPRLTQDTVARGRVRLLLDAWSEESMAAQGARLIGASPPSRKTEKNHLAGGLSPENVDVANCASVLSRGRI